MKRYNLVITEEDKTNILGIIDAAMVRGSDSAYIVGLKTRIHGAEELEPTAPPPEPNL